MTSDRNIGYDPATPPEAEAKYICECCGAGIYEGDSFYWIAGERVCESCVEQLREIA